jgi:hypothetical protein
MIQYTRLLAFVTIFVCLSLTVKSQHRNLLQVKTNLFFFKGSELKFNPIVLPFNVIYSRFIKDKPYFIGGNFSDFYASYYEGDYWRKKRGDVVSRSFITIGSHVGYKLQATPKRAFLAKAGLVYRIGYESQFYSAIQKPNFTEIFNSQYKYRDLGFEISAEEQFSLGSRWSLSVGGGYQYFLARNTTNHQLWVNAWLGYAF